MCPHSQSGDPDCENKPILEQLVQEGACNSSKPPSSEQDITTATAVTSTSLSGMKKPKVKKSHVVVGWTYFILLNLHLQPRIQSQMDKSSLESKLKSTKQGEFACIAGGVFGSKHTQSWDLSLQEPSLGWNKSFSPYIPAWLKKSDFKLDTLMRIWWWYIQHLEYTADEVVHNWTNPRSNPAHLGALTAWEWTKTLLIMRYI